MRKIIYSLLLLMSFGANAQDKVVKLYPEVVPNSKSCDGYTEIMEKAKDESIRIKKITDPEMLVFFPKKLPM